MQPDAKAGGSPLQTLHHIPGRKRRVRFAFAQRRILPDMQQMNQFVPDAANVFLKHGPAVLKIIALTGLKPLLEDKKAAFKGGGEVFDGVGHTRHGFPHHGHAVSFQKLTGPGGHKLLKVFGVPPHLLAQGVPLGGALEGVLKHVVVDGLDEEVRRAEAQAVDGDVHVPVPGDHDHLRIRALAAHPLQQGEPVHAGHTDVADDQREGMGGEKVQRLGRTRGALYLIAEIPDQGFEHAADAGFVVNEQNAEGSVHACLSFLPCGETFAFRPHECAGGKAAFFQLIALQGKSGLSAVRRPRLRRPFPRAPRPVRSSGFSRTVFV